MLDFSDVPNLSSLPPFQWLVIIAEKASTPEELLSFCRKCRRNLRKRKISETEAKPEVNPNPSSLPTEFREQIRLLGGNEARMVIRKKITKCDVSKSHARITMPERQCGDGLLLTQEEMAKLEERDEKNHLVGIGVDLIQPNQEVIKLTLKKWECHGRTSNFVLINGWNEVVEKNGLKEGDDVQIWGFRDREGHIAFALLITNIAANESRQVNKRNFDHIFEHVVRRRRT